MSRLLLVRHGNTELNSARMFMGHSDIELSVTGYKQVERLRERLAGERIDVVYSSDLRRTLVTAETIASTHQLEVITCPELREINYGKLERLTFEEIGQLYPDVAEMCRVWSPQLKFPGGESFDEFKQRVSKFRNKIKQYSSEETILVVTHSGPLRIMLCYLLELELRHWRQISIDLASLSVVAIYPEIAIINLLNDTSHLGELG